MLTPLPAFLNRPSRKALPAAFSSFCLQMQRFPVRPRGLIKSYMRPYLIDWDLSCSTVMVEIHVSRESQCGLLTEIQVTSDWGGRTYAMLSRLSLQLSPIRRWSVVIEPCATVGITDHQGDWIPGMCDDRPTWIEMRSCLVSDTWWYALAAMKSTGRDRALISNLAQRADRPQPPERRFDFVVDLFSNTLTVSFEHYVLQAVVPHLCNFRPYVWFSLRDPHTFARFLEP